MRKLFCWMIVSSFLWACGRDDDSKLDQTATQGELLSFHETPKTADQPQSYLVAFRRLLDDKKEHFAAFPTRLRTHMQALVKNYALDLGRSQSRYLASLDLADLGHSFVAPAGKFGPGLLQENLQESTGDSLASLVEVTFPNDLEARTTLRKWMSEGRIYYAEPNGRSELKGAIEDAIISQFDNNNSTPWLEQIGFINAINQMSALADADKVGPVVAVMDSGVDVKHKNLRAAIFENSTGQNKLCKDDFYGCNTTVAKKEILGDGAVYPAGTSDFGQECPFGQDSCQHGTHVAGLIAARDATGYVGLCPYCRILVVKVVDIEKTAENKTAFVIKDASIIAGLAYVSGFKSGSEPLVRVINASFGKFERSRSVELFIKSLKGFGRGTLMVAAAGNEDTMRRQYPAAFDSVIAVSNVISESTIPSKSSSSNFGTWVDIAAPGDGYCLGSGGQGILSSVPGGGLDGNSACKIGTSMASPVVAGIAGLLLTKEPTLTAEQVERRLLDTAVPDKLYTDSVNNAYRPNVKGMGLVPMLGSGVVNANLALDPASDDSPAVTTKRSDLVRAGCGVIGAGSGNLVSWLVLALPLLGMGWRFGRKK